MSRTFCQMSLAFATTSCRCSGPPLTSKRYANKSNAGGEVACFGMPKGLPRGWPKGLSKGLPTDTDLFTGLALGLATNCVWSTDSVAIQTSLSWSSSSILCVCVLGKTRGLLRQTFQQCQQGIIYS